MAVKFGPGAMVAAAFIGPGTLTTATAAGVATGAGLLWAVGFSVLATAVLQELSLRSALVTQRDLAHSMRALGPTPLTQWALVLLIVTAVGVGNAAYQSGNLTGAALGLNAALGLPLPWVVGLASVLAGVLIALDRYHYLERVLVGLVAVMALLFVSMAVLLLPDFLDQPVARLRPQFDSTRLTLILALIGTTVVPYNLFLHATAARRRWRGQPLPQALHEARWESAISIVLGGIITAAMVVVASVLVPAEGDGSVLEGLAAAFDARYPAWGRWAVGGGLFAAGLTSAIAAPVAAGWAVCSALGLSTEPGSRAFKQVALLVLAVGALFALTAVRPVALIITAQATNALLLPVVALLLWLLSSRRSIMGAWCNGPVSNALSLTVLLIVTILAVYKLLALLR